MIAVDAMGGDLAPQAVVHGAYKAAQSGISVQLFGDYKQLDFLLSEIDKTWESLPISIEHCTQVIQMGDEPTRSVIRKKDASLVRAMEAVADGRAQAIVSAGNSGAALVAGTLILKRIKGINRPAIGEFLPTRNGSVFCMDLGANTDCKPELLYQFAHMGHAYVSLIKKIENPRVALLSNGSEPYKGSLAVKEVYDSLTDSELNFVGNVEARDLFDDRTDVLICDGFVGNIVLKSMQGMVGTLSHWLLEGSSKSWFGKIRLAFGVGIFKSIIKQKVDYTQKGGALLLGVNHPLIVAHGCSDALTIKNAIIYAQQVVQQGIIPEFKQITESLNFHKWGIAQRVSKRLKSIIQKQ